MDQERREKRDEEAGAIAQVVAILIAAADRRRRRLALEQAVRKAEQVNHQPAAPPATEGES